MKYIKLFEYFDRHIVNRDKHIQKDEARLFQDIVDLIKKSLGKSAEEIVDVSKIVSDFGHSWYIIFENGRQIRISDHDVVSLTRKNDAKYIDFIDVYDDFDKSDADRVVKLYQADKITMRNKKPNIETNKEVKEYRDVIFNTNQFLNKLRNGAKAIYKSTGTRDSLYNFKRNHPKAEYIYQVDNGDTYSYTWVELNTKGGGSLFVDKDYYEFLKQKNYL